MPSVIPVGLEFRVNAALAGSRSDPSWATLSNGNYVVAWTSGDPKAWVRVPAPNGAPLGGDIKVNTAARSNHASPPLFDETDNIVDFNTIDTADFSGPFNNALGGNDVVTLPDSAATIAALMAGGFSGGDGNDQLTEGAARVPLLGGAGDDVLVGNAGPDVLAGEDGNDTMTGNGGGDQMIGGAGDDIYNIASAADSIVEQEEGGGTDTVRTSLSVYVLRDHVENLTFIGTGSFAGAGNDLDNVITGGTGAASELVGGAGHDTYVVSVAGDTIVEESGGGTDTIRTTLAVYTLRAEVEKLVFVGTGRFDGAGNALDNVIAGGTGAASELIGGIGDDTYVVSVAGDTLVEQTGAGTDTVETTLLLYRLAAPNVENLTYTGTGDFTGVGNALNNRITGGDGLDYLYAGAGTDTLVGGGGADVFLFDEAVNGIDNLLDFVTGIDRIFLNGSVFAHTPTFNLVQGEGPLTAPDGNTTFFYHSDTGEIGYDADGNGAGAEIIFATIFPGQSMAASDFLFY